MCKKKKAKKSISKLYNESVDISLEENEVNITNHFCKRWNERVLDEPETMEDVQNHLKTHISTCKTLKAVSGDFYLLNDYLVIAAKKENIVTLITTFGSTKECNTVYEYIKNYGAFSFNQTIKKYGKIPLNSYC